jgi:hypothetical protein
LKRWVSGSEDNPSSFGGMECSLGALRDQFPFPLRDQRQNPNGELIDVWAVAANEADVGILKAQEKLSVATEAVQLGYNQGGLHFLRHRQSLRQGRAFLIGLRPGLYFAQHSNQLAPLTMNEIRNDLFLASHS